MADDDKQELTNAEARRACIHKGFADIYDQEHEIERLTELHLKEPKEERTRLWRRLKSDVNIPRKVLDLEYRRYKAVRKMADEAEDTVELDSLLDQLREMHDTLHPGGQVDWIAAINRVPE